MLVLPLNMCVEVKTCPKKVIRLNTCPEVHVLKACPEVNACPSPKHVLQLKLVLIK